MAQCTSRCAMARAHRLNTSIVLAAVHGLSGLILQALVYDILPSTTALFSYAICPRKLLANEQFFCWYSNSSKFVTNNSIKQGVSFIAANKVYTSTNKITFV